PPLTRMARPRCPRRRASARPSSVRVSARGSAWSRSSGRWPWSSLVVVEAGLGELRLDGPADQIADEDTRGVGHLALLRDAGRVDGDLLQILRQRADEGHALDGQDLADLVHDDLGLALDDGLGRVAARPQDRLALHRVGDAE